MPAFLVLVGGLLVGVLALLLWPARARRRGGDVAGWLAAADDDLAGLEQGRTAPGDYVARRRAANAGVRQQLVATPADRAGRRLAAGVAVVVLGGSAALYAALGHPELASAPVAAAPGVPGHAQGGAELQDLATRLAARLAQAPGDVQGWEMLGRSYTALGRFAEASAAYAHAADRADAGAALLADYADALVASHGGRFDAAAEGLIARALQADPHESKALSLAGTVAYDRGDYATAIRHWSVLAGQLPEGSVQRRGIEGSLADARAAAGGPPGPGAARPVADSAAPTAATLSGEIRISPRLAAQVGAGDTLFVYARRSGVDRGPPVAVRKLPASFPAAFELGDADAMGAGETLSAAGRVTLSARVSHDGSVRAQPGDPVGRLDDVAPGRHDLELVIDAPAP